MEFETEDFKAEALAGAATRAVCAFLVDNEIRVLDLKTSKIVAKSEEKYACTKLRMSQDGRFVACGIRNEGKAIHIFETDSMRLVKSIRDEELVKKVLNIDFEFNRDGKSINYIVPFFGDDEDKSSFMQLNLESLESKKLAKIKPYTLRASISPDGKQIMAIVNGIIDYLNLIEIGSEQEDPVEPIKDKEIGTNLLAWSQDGESVFTAPKKDPLNFDQNENLDLNLKIISLIDLKINPVLDSEGNAVVIVKSLFN